MMLMRSLSMVATLICSFSGFAAENISDADREFFESKIRPVFVEHCYSCHNSSDTAEGGLSLDFRGGIVQGGDRGPTIRSDQPESSLLVRVLRHEIDGLEMPEGGGKLDEAVIADIESWIRRGAPDPRDQPPSEKQIAAAMSWENTLERRKQWWSFQPIREVAPPGPEETHSNPIDRFVDRKLREQQLQPAPPADSETLVRRLYVNLVGLPPTADQSRRWTLRLEESDPPQAAIERLVDELLQSPQFGERWARHWMDWIRYAESHGSEGDPRIDNAWLFRDYLIRAMNSDVPCDQLILEQIAGDLIENPRVVGGINESMIGPAHLRMVFHGFSPTDALDEKVRFVDDQINVLSKAFLGLTVSCARCHDHKFDAISQTDYFALFGILASCRPARQVIDVVPERSQTFDRLAALKRELKKSVADHWIADSELIARRLLESNPESTSATPLVTEVARLRDLIDKSENFETAWSKWIEPVESARQTQERFLTRPAVQRWDFSGSDGSQDWYAVGPGLQQTAVAGEFSVATKGTEILSGIYPRGRYTHGLSSKSAGRFSSPDTTVGEGLALWVLAIGGEGASLRYVVQDFPRNGTIYPVNKLNDQWTWHRFDLSYWSGDSLHVELTNAKDAPVLTADRPRSWFGVRHAVIADKDAEAPPVGFESSVAIVEALRESAPTNRRDLADAIAVAIRGAAESWQDDRATDHQLILLEHCLRSGLLPNSSDDVPNVASVLSEYRTIEAALPIPTRVPGLDETIAVDQPLMIRGNHKTLGDPVPRRFLEAIDGEAFETAQSGRLEWARQVVSPRNPLTKRVIVNRIWHHLFGRGIVSTPDNFGRLGDQPSYPELLDYLAARFDQDGWSLKSLIRLIVTSRTWQRDSSIEGDNGIRDPENRFLARGSVRRLDAEAIRDSLLQVSGGLDLRQFGPPVNTKTRRRSVYVSVIRNALDPFLRAFDFPEPFATVGRRDVTNVPAQSLALMNDPQVLAHARRWAKASASQASEQSPRAAIDTMFRQAFSRPAGEQEIERATQFLMQSRDLAADTIARRDKIRSEIETTRARIESTMNAARDRLRTRRIDPNAADAAKLPSRLSAWDFRKSTKDSVGELDLRVIGQAQQTAEGLQLSGGHAVSGPLPRTLKEKTLEAWVRLDDLQQRGGGVMSIQTPDGVTFDSIVFGERDPGQWLAGSNNFRRTEPLGGPPETDSVDQTVHVAITYDEQGTITAYRNGQPYGNAYKSSGLQQFDADQAIVSFGVRHLPAVGNRLLRGLIIRAHLYDRALTAAEIETSANQMPEFFSEETVFQSLSNVDRRTVERDRAALASLEYELETLGDVGTDPEIVAWTELAQALFLFKEFIYVR